MVERGALWTLTVLFLIGAAGRFEGPAAMLSQLLAPIGAAVDVAPAEGPVPEAEELAGLVETLDADEAAALLGVVEARLAEDILALVPERKAADIRRRL